MVAEKNFTFSGILEAVRFNRTSAAVFVPHHIAIVLPRGRTRARGIINGVSFSVSIIFRKDRGRYFPISKALRKAADITPGDPVGVTFQLIPEGAINIPETGETLISDYDKGKRIWRRLSISPKDIMAGYITAVKSIDSRLRNAFANVQRGQKTPRQPQPSRRKRNT